MRRRALGYKKNGIPTGNLLMYLRFNGNANDEVGSHTAGGFSNGITYTNGIYSGTASEAVLFNANTDYIGKLDSDDFSFGDGSTDSPFSITTGIVFDSSSGDTQDFIVMKRGANGGSSLTDWEWNIGRRVSTGVLAVLLYDHSSGGYLQHESTTSLSNSTNYHLTITYDGSSSVSGIKIYIDAVEEGSYTDSSSGTYTAMENLSAPLIIGSIGWAYTSGSQGNEFLGKLDGFGIWNKELSQEEITAIYNKQSAGNEIL